MNYQDKKHTFWLANMEAILEKKCGVQAAYYS